MKIKCISEKILKDNSEMYQWSKNSEFELTLGKTYVVLAVSKYMNSIFFYILAEESDNYPLAFPAELFDIVDSTFSKYWVNSNNINSLAEIQLNDHEIISFQEWNMNQDKFYENVLEEIEPEFTIFKTYRDKILKEANG